MTSDDRKGTRQLNLPGSQQTGGLRPVQLDGALDKLTTLWSIQFLIMGHSIPIQMNVQGKLLIGRSDGDPNNEPDIDLTYYGGSDKGVSRRHAQILATENMLLISDLGSTNGTRLNGVTLRPYEPYRLHHNDEVQIGMIALKVNFAMVPFHNGLKVSRKGVFGTQLLPAEEDDGAIRRILIIEHDENVAEMFAALLRALGYEVYIRYQTGEAMRFIAGQLPHAIFTDLHLPDLPGTEVCRMLRSDMATRHLPIFVISDDTDEATINGALEAGADMFLSRPVGVDELLSALGKFVGSARPDK